MTDVQTLENLLKEQFSEGILELETFLDQHTFLVSKLFLIPILTFLKEDPSTGFRVLMDLTAVDYLAPQKQTKVVYRLHQPDTLERVQICIQVKREERLPSVTPLWVGADWYERELFDLFGIHFEGHPDLKRILLPDDWEGHPLRKDYALTEEAVQFKHGVTPKVPSEIILHDSHHQP